MEIDEKVFPVVLDVSIGAQGTKEYQSISLPRGANLLYLQTVSDQTELRLLNKYVNKETFSDSDYKALFKLFITNIPRLSPPQGNIADFMEQFGVYLEKKENEVKFSLIEEYIPQIKIDTWDCIAVSLLKPIYTDIINCFDFGDIKINLGSWKSDFDIEKQSLLNAFRSAFMFTIVGYLYGDDCNLYESFNDYFENEYYKRVAFLHGAWKHREGNKPISYIPIFDSFYNLNGLSSDMLIQTLYAILDDKNIVQDEREMIRNRLIEGAEEIHRDKTSQSFALEQSVVKPVVNFVIELQIASDNINAANSLLEEKLYEASINRSYYSMMHALKALLEYKKQLSDWEPDKLNVSENHKALERKLEGLVYNKVIKRKFYADFKYVKQKRWIADYNIYNFSKIESEECVRKATEFYKEVKKHTV